MKAIAIIDMPERCDDCLFFFERRYPRCDLLDKLVDACDDKRPDACPLKPLAENSYPLVKDKII